MKKTWVTKLYYWFKGWKCEWLNTILEMLLKDVIEPALKQFTQHEIEYIESLILGQWGQNTSGIDKLKSVTKSFKKRFNAKHISSSILNFAIELLYQKIKKNKEADKS